MHVRRFGPPLSDSEKFASEMPLTGLLKRIWICETGVVLGLGLTGVIATVGGVASMIAVRKYSPLVELFASTRTR